MKKMMNKGFTALAAVLMMAAMAIPGYSNDQSRYNPGNRYGPRKTMRVSRYSNRVPIRSHVNRRRILNEIRANERQIRRLEMQIHRYRAKARFRRRSGSRYYMSRIAELQRRIARLEIRNRHLRRML